MSITPLYAIALVLGLSACGPSAEEKLMNEQRAQALVDSIKNSAQQELLSKQATLKAMEDSAQGAYGEYYALTEAVAASRAELVVAKDRLSRVSNFQLGRLRDERESQLREATIKLEEASMQVAHYEKLAEEAKERADRLAQALAAMR